MLFIVRTIQNTVYKNSVRTSQETHYLSATKTNRLMLFKETVSVYCENHTEHTNKQNAGSFNIKAQVTIVTAVTKKLTVKVTVWEGDDFNSV
jgi:hypothetical protein